MGCAGGVGAYGPSARSRLRSAVRASRRSRRSAMRELLQDAPSIGSRVPQAQFLQEGRRACPDARENRTLPERPQGRRACPDGREDPPDSGKGLPARPRESDPAPAAARSEAARTTARTRPTTAGACPSAREDPPDSGQGLPERPRGSSGNVARWPRGNRASAMGEPGAAPFRPAQWRTAESIPSNASGTSRCASSGPDPAASRPASRRPADVIE